MSSKAINDKAKIDKIMTDTVITNKDILIHFCLLQYHVLSNFYHLVNNTNICMIF